jgi:hypothetical protein
MIPGGRLVASRVVDDPGAALEAALDRGLTGYAVLEPGDALLLAGETRGVVTFEAGVPVLAYERGGDRGGREAVRALEAPGPTRVEFYRVDAADLAEAHADERHRVPPGFPASTLGDEALATRTRDAAPADRVSEATSAVESFLADDERVAEVRERARAEAQRRAREWGLADELDGADAGPDASPDAGDPGAGAGGTDADADGRDVDDASDAVADGPLDADAG